jgi:hypothetical protein
MKYYVMAVVLIVALAGFGVQLLDSRTGMAVAPQNIGTQLQGGVVCSQLKTEIDNGIAQYEGKGCDNMGVGDRINLICPPVGILKSGYSFDIEPSEEEKMKTGWVPPGHQLLDQCRNWGTKIVNKVELLEKSAEKDKNCGSILHSLRAPLKCSAKTRAYPTRD